MEKRLFLPIEYIDERYLVSEIIYEIPEPIVAYTFNYDLPSKVTSVTDANGFTNSYEYNENGNIIKITDPYDNMETSIWDADMNKISFTDKNGNTWNYAYDEWGNLLQTENPLGHASTSTYEPVFNRITSKTNENGCTTYYEYDNHGNLIKTIDTIENPEIYEYNSFGNMITLIDKIGHITNYKYDVNGNKIKRIDALGYETQYFYDDIGNLVREIDPNGHQTQCEYDKLDRRTKFIDSLGYETQYFYDDVGNLVREIDPNGHQTQYGCDKLNRQTKIIDALWNENEYIYDPVGNLIATIDPKGHETKYKYNKLDRRIKVIDSLGYETQYFYDDVGNLVREIDANGNDTRYEHDALDRLISVTRPFETDKSKSADNEVSKIRYLFDDFLERHPLLGAWLKSLLVDFFNEHPLLKNRFERRHPLLSDWLWDYAPRPRGTDYAITKYEYDHVGNKIAEINPNGYRTEYEYNERNELVKTINPEGETVSSTYDNVGNLKTTTRPNRNIITYHYDKKDQLIEVYDSIGLVAQSTYDPVGNKLTETDGNGHTTGWEYNAVNKLTSMFDPMGETMAYTYDPVGNLLNMTDRNNNPTSYTYDATNKRITTTNALGDTTWYEYDCCNLVKITDANGNATTCKYDTVNRVIRETYADGTTREFTYDGVGNLIARKDQLGQITKYEYNDLYYLIKQDYPGSNDDIFTYDKAGRMLKASNSDSTVTFEYDKADWLIQTKQNNYLIEYEYDIPNNRRTIKYPVYKKSYSKSRNPVDYPMFFGDGSVVETRDKRDRLTDVEKIGEGIIAHYVYDDADRLLSKTYLNDVTSSYSYNDNDWVTSLQHNKDSTLIAGFNYYFDKEGNRKYSENLLPFDPSKEYTHSERCVYDGIYQLFDFKTGELVGGDIPYPIKTRTWTLDPVGNWDQFIIDGESYKNTPNQMNEYDDPSTDGPPPIPDDDGIPDDFKDAIATPEADGFNFAHDKNGNLVDDCINTYEYDYENRLIRVTRKSDNAILGEYRYDALSRRIEKDTFGVTTVYLYDDNRVIEERIGGSVEAEYTYGDWIDEVLTMDRGDQTYYYHTNSLGSTITLTASSGDVVERYAYDAYGTVTIMDDMGELLSDSAVDNPYMFTGRRFDPEIGMFHYRARMYNPMVGRFTSRDPLGMINGMNIYTYAGNNPANFVDPTGCKIHQAYTQLSWKYKKDKHYLGKTINRVQVDTKICCCLHHERDYDHSSPNIRRNGKWFYLDAKNDVAVSTFACTCRGRPVDGLLITVEHAVQYRGTLSWTPPGGVFTKYIKNAFGKVTGWLDIDTEAIVPSNKQKIYRYWIHYLICPTGGPGDKPSIQNIWYDKSRDPDKKLIPYDLTIGWNY